ncbi:hypothetical protein CHUAL_012176 [Chamberlinius hualienensis]
MEKAERGGRDENEKKALNVKYMEKAERGGRDENKKRLMLSIWRRQSEVKKNRANSCIQKRIYQQSTGGSLEQLTQQKKILGHGHMTILDSTSPIGIRISLMD